MVPSFFHSSRSATNKTKNRKCRLEEWSTEGWKKEDTQESIRLTSLLQLQSSIGRDVSNLRLTDGFPGLLSSFTFGDPIFDWGWRKEEDQSTSKEWILMNPVKVKVLEVEEDIQPSVGIRARIISSSTPPPATFQPQLHESSPTKGWTSKQKTHQPKVGSCGLVTEGLNKGVAVRSPGTH